MRFRSLLSLAALLLLTGVASAAPPPRMSVVHPNVFMVPQISSPPIQFKNAGTPIGVSFTFNCSTGTSCSMVNGVLTLIASGSGGTISSCGTANAIPYFSAATTLTCDPGITTNTSGQLSAAGVSASDGSCTGPTFNFTGHTGTGISRSSSNFVCWSLNGNDEGSLGTGVQLISGNSFGWVASGSVSGGSTDTDIARGAAGVVTVDTSTPGNALGTIKPGLYATGTNCSSGASPAVCVAAAAGSVAVPAGTNSTLVVQTTAVTANSQIFLQSDSTLGTKLGVTCNSTLASLITEPVITARTGGTSFTITVSGTTTTNPVCFSYHIVN